MSVQGELRLLEKPNLRHFILACLVALQAACATRPATAPAIPPEARAAARAQAEGDWSAAARWWEQAADSAAPEAAAGYVLNAAETWQLAGQARKAKELLHTVRPELLSAAGRTRLALITAELALEDGDLQAAEFYLDAAGQSLDISLRPRYERARQRLVDRQADPSAHAIAAASAAILDIRKYQPAEAVSILRLLEDVPGSRLESLALSPTPIGRWAELAIAVRRSLVDTGDLLPAATRWEAGHPEHWADAAIFMELCWHYGRQFRYPDRIAVLLPNRGNLAPAGAAIRDGLMTAYLAQMPGTELHFVPVGDDPAEALVVYSRVAALDYQWVIGPLRRDSVDMIATLDQLPVPVLLLNDPSPGLPATNSSHPWMYSVSLSQEAEARAVARKIQAAGHLRVMLLVADSPWGDRVMAAFEDEFVGGAGEVVATERFGASAEDHAAKLAEILRVEASRERRRLLQEAIGLTLEFEPSRRDDFDAIFLAADPVLGRQLKPQLRFYDAGDKPMFAMSRVFSGHVDTAADQDLNGVLFATTHWAVDDARDHGETRLESLRDGVFGALYELGMDAFTVLRWLELLRKDPDLAFPGAIGRLRLAPDGHLEREPVWARFERGRPVVHLDDEPR